MDIWSPDKRSKVMSRIRSKDTKPELILRSYLHKAGFRFRCHSKQLPGKPDIVLKKYSTVIFVNGCFWHYHENCPEGRIPASNFVFWKEKISKTILRDKEHIEKLEKLNWNVIVVWECEIERKLLITLDKICNELKSQVKTN